MGRIWRFVSAFLFPLFLLILGVKLGFGLVWMWFGLANCGCVGTSGFYGVGLFWEGEGEACGGLRGGRDGGGRMGEGVLGSSGVVLLRWAMTKGVEKQGDKPSEWS